MSLCFHFNVAVTCVYSSSEYPCSSCHSSLNEAFSKDLLEFWLKLKILKAPMHRDEKFRELKLPLFGHQMQKKVRLCVKRHTYILQK